MVIVMGRYIHTFYSVGKLNCIFRGGSWELAGSCVGCPIDGHNSSTADGYLPMTVYNTTAES